MASPTPPSDIDPNHLAHSQHFWSSFTKLSTYSAIGVVVILILLALFVA